MKNTMKQIRRQIKRANMTPAERKLRRDWLRAHMGKVRHITAQEGPNDRTRARG